MHKSEKKVKVNLFYDHEHYTDDVFVSVNGVNYQIKRGVEVEVPQSVAEVLASSAKQDAIAKALMQQARNGGGA